MPARTSRGGRSTTSPGSPADPDRVWAAPSGGWFGQVIQRSDDGGTSWDPVGNDFSYATPAGEHQWYDGSLRPWEFARVWHLEPSPTDRDVVWAGIQDAALFKTTDGGDSWHELPALREHPSGPKWQPGAGGMCLHTIVLDPTDENRMTIAISAAGVFRTEDGGTIVAPEQPGTALRRHPVPRCRGRALRAQPGDASRPSRHAVHAEALGRHAQ